MILHHLAGVAPALVLLQPADATPLPVRGLLIAALAIVALVLLLKAARCALRVVALAVLAAAAWLAWRWFV